ncbi:hypothetical protein KP509_05G103400 [Ceratopteris richardii]|uniref:Uncharacterized protein n=1 Tax=Ceratopteris richardii TaxID=49495 RepID=A0A8T2UX66_CERRI|nr:hypothetical protein KP509_05G103400 [Ceratopteris richardii]
MGRLSMPARLAVLGSFNVSLYLAYLAVIEHAKRRGGAIDRDGYTFLDMWKKPKHMREEGQQGGLK